MPSDNPETAITHVPAPNAPPAEASAAPARQLGDLPLDELRAIAEELGVDADRYALQQDLVAAIHARRQMIASFDREAMLDVIRWGRRPLPINATKDHIAVEILRIKSMRFNGLSDRGLRVLAMLRGCEVLPDDDVPKLVRKLKRLEGFFAKLGRKRRALMGSLVGKILGDSRPTEDYQFLPPTDAQSAGHADSPRAGSIKEEIEEAGLIGGITSRIKRSADSYLNQKLDEIEARIDRKLDEIDRRLAEWRDKEVANRIRILKITLWVSVIVALVSLLYMYLRVVFGV